MFASGHWLEHYGVTGGRTTLSSGRLRADVAACVPYIARCFPFLAALGSSDPVCARHALALASLVARDRTGAGAFIAAVEPLLTTNVEAAKRTGGWEGWGWGRRGWGGGQLRGMVSNPRCHS